MARRKGRLSRLIPRPEVSTQAEGSEGIVMDPATGGYFGLNTSGLELWRAILDGHGSRPELEELLVSRHGVTPMQAKRDIRAFVDELTRNGLVQEE